MVRTVGDDPGDRKLLDDVATHGWHCVHILEDEDGPEYSFTVGLFHSFGHPELIIFGLSAKVAHQILEIMVDAAKAGTPIDLSKPTDELLNNYTCCFADVPHAQYHEHVGFCRWFYEGNHFPLYQIVWPSRAGLYPWHPDASAEFKAMQPVIAHAPLGA